MINRVNFLKVSREWELENSGVGPGRWYRLICVKGEEKRGMLQVGWVYVSVIGAEGVFAAKLVGGRFMLPAPTDVCVSTMYQFL